MLRDLLLLKLVSRERQIRRSLIPDRWRNPRLRNCHLVLLHRIHRLREKKLPFAASMAGRCLNRLRPNAIAFGYALD